MGGDLRGGVRSTYYERIDPPPGRPWNRYRLDYIPFADTLKSLEWRRATILGQGPDFFPAHLAQLRQVPGGAAIPRAQIYGWPIVWLLLLISGVAWLGSPTRDLMHDS